MLAAVRWSLVVPVILSLVGSAGCVPADGSVTEAAQTASVPGGSAPVGHAPAPLTLTVLDLRAEVGGQAVLVSDSSGPEPRYVLIDGGDREAAAVERLQSLGVTELALVVLSHPHTDHYVGLIGVLRGLPVRAFAWNGDTRTLASFRRLVRAVERSAPTVLFVENAPRTIMLSTSGADTIRLTLLPPPPRGLSLWGNAINNRSVGVRIERGAFAALVPGDAEHGQLGWWTRHHPELLRADVLVASHHGSDDANATARRPRWYRTVTPSVLLVSANGRQHPYANVLTHAWQHRVATYCTHTHGDLTVRVAADGRWTVATSREQPCTPGTEAPR